jgi:uncharacterized membrane protein (DUF485 family)
MEHAARLQPEPLASAANAAKPSAVPGFDDYLRRRRRFIWSLTWLMLAVYFGYILTLAYRPDLVAVKLQAGLPTSLGIPVGFGMLLFTFCLVAVYVWKANTVFDRMVNDIRKDGV